MVEEKDKKTTTKPSNLHLERSLSIRSQTSECCNADLSPGIPNNEKRPNFQTMMSVEQRNSLLKPSATALRDSAALNMAPEAKGYMASASLGHDEGVGGGTAVPVVDNMRNHRKNKDTHVMEMAAMAENLKQRADDRRSPTMPHTFNFSLPDNTKHKQTLKQKSFWCTACVFVIMLLIVSGILSAVFFVINKATFIGFKEDMNDMSPMARSFCVPCDDLRLSSDPIDDVADEFDVVKPSGQDELCCAHTSEQILHIINLVSWFLFHILSIYT